MSYWYPKKRLLFFTRQKQWNLSASVKLLTAVNSPLWSSSSTTTLVIDSNSVSIVPGPTGERKSIAVWGQGDIGSGFMIFYFWQIQKF